jgi:hypothetical protein
MQGRYTVSTNAGRNPRLKSGAATLHHSSNIIGAPSPARIATRSVAGVVFALSAFAFDERNSLLRSLYQLIL